LLLAADALIAARSRTGRSFAALRRTPMRPCPTDNPDAIAFYAIAALGRIDDQAHATMLSVLDGLISMEPEPSAVDRSFGRRYGISIDGGPGLDVMAASGIGRSARIGCSA
jgi:hypothetical protein